MTYKIVPVIGKVVVSSGVTRMRTKEEEAKDTVVQLPKVKINRTGDLLRRWQEPVEANDENALIKHLNRPLEEEEKIPISRDEFDYLVTDCHCNDPKSELGAKDAAMLFRVSDEEMALGIYIRFADALDRTPTESGNEAACLTTRDLNISSIVKLILSQGKVIRDSNKGTNTELKRPDYGFLVNNHCLFRGEEEAPDSNGDPKTELVNKLVSYIYQPLNFIIGYYAIGPMVNYVSITSSMQTQPLFGHDLMSKRERLKNLVHLIRLCGVLFWMGSKLAPRINPEYHTFIRDDGTEIRIGAVVKKLFKHNEAAQHVNDLRKIYQLLADKQVPNVDKLVKSGVEDGHAYIITQPIGMDWHPFNGTDLFNVATCVLQTLKIMHSGPNPVYHRDIRQPNILKRRNEDGQQGKPSQERNTHPGFLLKTMVERSMFGV
ncbi:hypothetical protein FRC18_012138 [Serendipita sp. 400]|nr:hypothetical protein FRC18_012138 [Serendipita sp. 400]